jgi:hypothetical protein
MLTGTSDSPRLSPRMKELYETGKEAQLNAAMLGLEDLMLAWEKTEEGGWYDHSSMDTVLDVLYVLQKFGIVFKRQDGPSNNNSNNNNRNNNSNKIKYYNDINTETR